MEIVVKRHTTTDRYTASELFIDRELFGHGLEPAWDTAGLVKPRAIPPGRYKVVLAISPKRGIVVPHVLDVPGFKAIEMHIGNFPRDTEGCLLVGLDRRPGMVLRSADAFKVLMAKLTDCSGEIFAAYLNEFAG